MTGGSKCLLFVSCCNVLVGGIQVFFMSCCNASVGGIQVFVMSFCNASVGGIQVFVMSCCNVSMGEREGPVFYYPTKTGLNIRTVDQVGVVIKCKMCSPDIWLYPNSLVMQQLCQEWVKHRTWTNIGLSWLCAHIWVMLLKCLLLFLNYE